MGFFVSQKKKWLSCFRNTSLLCSRISGWNLVARLSCCRSSYKYSFAATTIWLWTTVWNVQIHCNSQQVIAQMTHPCVDDKNCLKYQYPSEPWTSMACTHILLYAHLDLGDMTLSRGHNICRWCTIIVWYNQSEILVKSYNLVIILYAWGHNVVFRRCLYICPQLVDTIQVKWLYPPPQVWGYIGISLSVCSHRVRVITSYPLVRSGQYYSQLLSVTLKGVSWPWTKMISSRSQCTHTQDLCLDHNSSKSQCTHTQNQCLGCSSSSKLDLDYNSQNCPLPKGVSWPWCKVISPRLITVHT